MPDLVVKNVDESTYKALERRARADGCRLDDWILSRLRIEAARTDLTIAGQPSAEEVQRRVDSAARIRAMTTRPIKDDATKLIRADRDQR